MAASNQTTLDEYRAFVMNCQSVVDSDEVHGFVVDVTFHHMTLETLDSTLWALLRFLKWAAAVFWSGMGHQSMDALIRSHYETLGDFGDFAVLQTAAIASAGQSTPHGQHIRIKPEPYTQRFLGSFKEIPSGQLRNDWNTGVAATISFIHPRLVGRDNKDCRDEFDEALMDLEVLLFGLIQMHGVSLVRLGANGIWTVLVKEAQDGGPTLGAKATDRDDNPTS